jgi:formylmethanofuran dehydrogenase subunit E
MTRLSFNKLNEFQALKDKVAANQEQCSSCGEDDFSPNIEAFELTGEILCDLCAEEAFEENGQFGVGA